MSKNPGFKTAFGAQTNSASILKPSYLENKESTGNISYEIFGASEKGTGAVNTNNIYMNGIYMKAFNYSNYSKGIKVNSENALFAVTCGQKGLDASLKAVELIDMEREYLCSKDNKKILKDFNSLFYKIHSEIIINNYNDFVSAGGVYITEKGITTFDIGGVGIFRIYNGKIERLNDDANRCYLGSRNGTVFVSTKNFGVKADSELYLICSEQVSEHIPQSLLYQMIEGKEPELAITSMIKQVSGLCKGADVSAVLIKVKRPELKKWWKF